LYVSGHGVKDDAGRLHFITHDSDSRLLASTAVSAVFARDQMDRTKSRRVIVLLDCCYAGAFPPGARHRAGCRVEFPQLNSRGRAVITSSSELEYAYEASNNAAATVTGQSTPSVFTGALVHGLRTGEADLDGDGLIEVNELYDYVYQQVRATAPQQNPQRKFELEGTLYLASSGRRPPFHGLPAGIKQAILGPHRRIREAAVSDLIDLVESADGVLARSAREGLLRLAGDTDPAISKRAAGALRSLGAAPPPPVPASPVPESLAPASPSPSRRNRPPHARRLPIVPDDQLAASEDAQPSAALPVAPPVPVEGPAPAVGRTGLAAVSMRWVRGWPRRLAGPR
jgi:hypothetical protein